ncbi:MAG: Hsp33 family molecular chaperone [Hyphomicrobium sp.]|jgi:molecular chaperone Hsp33
MADSAATTEVTRKTPRDDLVLPFRTERSGIIGRLVRLGPAIDEILSHHAAPVAVSQALGEAVALTAMLGTALKIDGKLTLQTKTDGLLDFLVVSYESPGRLRGYARYDKRRITVDDDVDPGTLLGEGHLAITIDPGDDMERYQGIVALDGEGVGAAALSYFRQSEQLPSFLRLAVARHYTAGENGAPGRWQWRAGGLLVQHLARAGGNEEAVLASEEDEEILGETDDDWERTRILASTVEDHELLDPMLAPERLLYRLFHEEGVRAFRAAPIEAFCRCSRERVHAFLKSFGAADLADMREPDGSISVTCEFCTKTYRFAPDEIT